VDLEWKDLFTAIALVLVLEGLMPFLSPSRMRKVMSQISQAEDHLLRTSGMISMLVGLGILYLVR